MSPRRTADVGNDKPHIHLKHGSYWCFQRVIARQERNLRRPRLRYRIGKGKDAAESFHVFCSNPTYHQPEVRL